MGIALKKVDEVSVSITDSGYLEIVQDSNLGMDPETISIPVEMAWMLVQAIAKEVGIEVIKMGAVK